VSATTLHVLGSGSRGNCFAVARDGAVLLVDAGFSAREIQRRAARAGLDLRGLAGIALTHEHGDHACGALRLAAQCGAPVLASPGTWAALGAPADVAFRPVGTARAEAGPFAVTGCPLPHDAREPLALAVHTADGTGIGLAYDLGRPTTAIRYFLRELTAVVLEANHDEVLLRTSDYPASVRDRIAGSGGHLSNRAAAELLVEVAHAGLASVVLAHLSQRCNTEAAARGTVEPALRHAGFLGDVHVARQDEPLPPIGLERRVGGQYLMGI
jgi:phosphoribosyl 1,2-cyclic phosphodiesterase